MKKILTYCGIGLAVIIISVALSVGLLFLIRNKNVEETGNILGVSWYNPEEYEFTISTVDELYELAALSDFYTFEDQTIKLDADIVVNEGNAVDWISKAPQKKWKPISKFAGTFDGQGYTISGLYGRGLQQPMAMFVESDNSATIQDFRLVNTYFKNAGSKGTASISAGGDGKYIKLYSNAILDVQGENGGGIASHVKANATFDECWFDGEIVQTGRYLGGIVGNVVNGRATIKHCLVTGKLTCLHDNANRDGNMVGGLVGSNSKTATIIISDTLANNEIETQYTTYVATLIGVNYSGGKVTLDNVYDSVISPNNNAMNNSNTAQPMRIGKEYLTGIKAYQWTTLDFDQYWAAVDNSTPVLKHFAENPLGTAGVEKAFDISWFKSGVYEFTITNLQQLYGFYMLSNKETFNNVTIKLGADIVVNSGNATDWKYSVTTPENPWFPIGNRVVPFNGTFDGQGHTISGVYLNANQSYSGLFGAMDPSGTIKNLKLLNSYYDLRNSNNLYGIGGIVGESRGVIDSVYTDVTIDTNAYQVGGIAGRMVNTDGTYSRTVLITNTWFAGEINLTDDGRYAGGLAGYIGNGTSIDDSRAKMQFTHSLCTGHITGTRTTSASVFDASVSKGGQSIGGLIGQNNGAIIVDIHDCLFAGKLELLYGTYAGAVIGRINSKGVFNISNTYCASGSYFLKGQSSGKLYEIHADATTNGGAVLLPDSFIKGYNSFTYTELDFNNYWAVVMDGTPILKSFATKIPSLAGREKMVDTSWYKSDAKELTINNVKELYGFWLLSASRNFESQTIKLGTDITVNSNDATTVQKWINGTEKPQNEWLAISSPTNAFAGTFDGQGHTISGLYLSLDQERNGFFSATAPGSMIKNFKLVNGLVYNMNSQNTYGIGTVAGEIRGSAENIYSNMTIYSNGYQLGGIAGRIVYMDKTHEAKLNINNCWFDGQIIMKDDGRHAGGFAGYIATGSGVDSQKGTINISNCLTTGYISNTRTTSASVFDASVSKGGQDIGGFFGTTNGSVVVNVNGILNASQVDIIYETYAGSFIGRFKNKSVFNFTNVYATSDVLYIKGKTNGRTHYEMQDTAVVNGTITILPDVMLSGANSYKFTNLDFQNYWAAIEDETPVLKTFATGQPADISQAKKMLDTSWYDKNAKVLIIDSAQDLYGFWQLSASEDFDGQIIRLGADIDLNEGWTPIVDETTGELQSKPSNPFIPIASVSNPFAGVFDGQGHTIRGLYMEVMQDYTGLFGATATGSVLKDFRLVDSYYDASNSYEGIGMGLIVGETRGKIDSVYTDATILAIGTQIGGIAGRVIYKDGNFKEQLSLNNCWFDGAIYLKDDGRRAGGIAGYVSYLSPVKKVDVEKYSINFENCLNSGYIYSSRKTSASVVDPSVSFGGQYVGGLIGMSDGTLTLNIKESLVSGELEVKYNTYVGAVVGRICANGTYNVTNTYATHESYIKDCLYYDITSTGVLNETNFKLVNADDIVNYYAHYALDLDLSNDWMALKTGAPVLRCLADESQEAVGNADWYKRNESPYVISIPEELDGFRVLVNNGTSFAGETVTLGADLVMKDDIQFKPIGVSSDIGFGGTFDGKGHSISGIRIDVEGTRNVGLFGYTLTNSEIKNFTLENSSVTNTGSGAGNTGILVGVGKGNISNVKIESDVTLTTDANPSAGFIGIFDNNEQERTISNCHFAGTIVSSTARVGAFAGRVYKGTLNIENCLNTGNITGNSKLGGFVGSGYGSEVTPVINIKNSLDMGTISGSSLVGSIVGSGAKTVINLENVYTTNEIGTYGSVVSENANPVEYYGIATILSEADLKGNEAYLNTKLNLKDDWQVSENGTPVLRAFATEAAMTSFTGLQVHKDWFNNGAVIAGQEMKVSEAFISTNADMRGFADIVNVENNTLAGVTIKLKNPLTFNKENEPWVEIGNSSNIYFSGIFNGLGNTISGIYLDDSTDESNGTGVFGTVRDATLKNFAIKDSYISGAYNTGGIVGNLRGNLENIYVASDVVIENKTNVTNTGGLVGIYMGKDKYIRNCWFAGSVSAQYGRLGGLVARVYSDSDSSTLTIEDCLVTGRVTHSVNNNARAGGFIGHVDKGCVKLTDCLMYGTLKTAGTIQTGSFIGDVDKTTTITNVYIVDNWVDMNDTKVNSSTYYVANGIGSGSTSSAVNGTVQVVSMNDLKGKIGVDTTKFDFCTEDYAEGIWVATNNGPELAKYHTSEAILDVPKQEMASSKWYQKGAETADGITYTLRTAGDMYEFANYVNSGTDNFTGDTVLLGNDIDFNNGWTPVVNTTGELTNVSSDVNQWTPIGDYDNTNGFNGTFDGQGYTIRGIYVNHSKRDSGLFGITNTKAVIKNVVVTDSYIKGTGNYNAVIAGTFRGTLMKNIYVTDSVTLNGAYANGGFTGMMSTNVVRTVSNCWFAGHIFASDKTAGGILGRSYAGTNTIENCLMTGTITSTVSEDARVGAYVGTADGTQEIKLINCMSIATLKVASKNHVGNAVGKCIITETTENAYVSNKIVYTGTSTDAFSETNVVNGTSFDATLFADKDAEEVVPGLFVENTAWKKVSGKHPVLAWTVK